MQKQIRAYVRAATPSAIKTPINELECFAANHGLPIESLYREVVSGLHLERPELVMLVDESSKGDVLLVDLMRTLTDLPYNQWMSLLHQIEDKDLIIVVAEMPMTLDQLSNDSKISKLTAALTPFIIEMVTMTAYKGLCARQLTQAEGIKRAQAAGKFKGKQINAELHADIKRLLAGGSTYSAIQEELKCSRSTIAVVKKIINSHAGG